jgi:hypothetical protein
MLAAGEMLSWPLLRVPGVVPVLWLLGGLLRPLLRLPAGLVLPWLPAAAGGGGGFSLGWMNQAGPLLTAAVVATSCCWLWLCAVASAQA